jgi:hypothetical protein
MYLQQILDHRRCRPCFQRFPESYVYAIARLTSSCPLETLPSDILRASTRSIHSEFWPYFGGIIIPFHSCKSGPSGRRGSCRVVRLCRSQLPGLSGNGPLVNGSFLLLTMPRFPFVRTPGTIVLPVLFRVPLQQPLRRSWLQVLLLHNLFRLDAVTAPVDFPVIL